MSYNQYPSPETPKTESLPIFKNLSFLSLFLIIVTFIVSYILQFVVSPLSQNESNIGLFFVIGFIWNIIHFGAYIVSLILAIKGHNRKHTPVLAIIMIVVSALLIAQALFGFIVMFLFAPFFFMA